MVHNNINPLTFTPQQLMDARILQSNGLENLFAQLNSKEYFTVYPPISQFVFFIAASIGISELLVSSIIIKVILLAFELGSILLIAKLLEKYNLNKSNVLIYALNPLVIIEIMANVHFEAIMVFFVVATFYFLSNKKIIVASLMMSLAVAAKLLPLIFMPAILLYLKSDFKWVKFLSYFTTFTILLFIPFFITLDIHHFLQSIDLYFQNFEFNASIYYVLRWLGKILTGYNQIIILGPLLGLITFIIIIKELKKEAGFNLLGLINFCLFSFVTYLVLSTTIHPWYLILPIALTVFQPRLYLMVWSLLIILSYATYQTADFEQNLFLIFIEYLLVFIVWTLERVGKISFKKFFYQVA
ncbi:MAG: hypothetical protein HKO66_16985 [Saprospiraceae bacterium]|nr:hypothetical protein [Bacteroidia bacterium]NNL93941.1 hypothetical protein [Saprospiraceae bacterium]